MNIVLIVMKIEKIMKMKKSHIMRMKMMITIIQRILKLKNMKMI